MAKIFKKYKRLNEINYNGNYKELSLFKETEIYRSALSVEPGKCSPEPEPVEIFNESFYYKEESPTTLLTERCSSSSFTDPEEYQKSVSPISTERYNKLQFKKIQT